MKISTMILAALVSLPATGASSDSSNIVYFVFAEPPPTGRDSFVLPLTRSDDIEHVRAWLRNPAFPPEGRSIPLFRIAPGSDGINRDYLAVGAPQWSGHVVEFVQFNQSITGDIASTPTYVEGHLDEWMASFRGYAAFFQAPLFELRPRPSPVVSTAVTRAGLDLRWTDLGVHYVYTVEVVPSVDSPNWIPAPGGACGRQRLPTG